MSITFFVKIWNSHRLLREEIWMLKDFVVVFCYLKMLKFLKVDYYYKCLNIEITTEII